MNFSTKVILRGSKISESEIEREKPSVVSKLFSLLIIKLLCRLLFQVLRQKKNQHSSLIRNEELIIGDILKLNTELVTKTVSNLANFLLNQYVLQRHVISELDRLRI